MNPAFDLLSSAWIPCVRSDGQAVELGLRDALGHSHELQGLHGESPLTTAALYRLLLAILHRVFGPADEAQWHELWTAEHWDMARLDPYLERWRRRFDLLSAEHPFYQAADPRVKPKSVTSLISEVASGNNPTLFDHHTDARGLALTPAQAARALVTAQAFGLAGLSGLPQKFTDGPCTRGVTFLVQGQTLFETLALNLVQYPSEQPLYCGPGDRPAWEMDDPYLPERSVPLGYLDYLTWQSRRILLLPESDPAATRIREMTIAPGLRLDSDMRDPMKHYSGADPKKLPRPLRFREGRVLWRDSAALFQLQASGLWPPQAFCWLSQLVGRGYLLESQIRTYLALGMANDQAKVHFYRQEAMPLPLRYLSDPGLVEDLQDALQMAEDSARQVWGATRTLAMLTLASHADAKGGRKPMRQDLDNLMKQWDVEGRYWSQLELPFREAIENLPGTREQALAAWRKALTQAGWESLDRVAEALSHDTARLKAVVRARQQLAAGLHRVLGSAATAKGSIT